MSFGSPDKLRGRDKSDERIINLRQQRYDARRIGDTGLARELEIMIQEIEAQLEESQQEPQGSTTPPATESTHEKQPDSATTHAREMAKIRTILNN